MEHELHAIANALRLLTAVVALDALGIMIAIMCRKKYGFVPDYGTAWLIAYTPTGRQRKPVPVDIDFSD